MQEKPRPDVSDEVCWWCPRCKTRKSIRQGSFFSKSRLTLLQWMILIFFWVDDAVVTSAARHADTSVNTAIAVYQWLREVCSRRLIKDGPPKLGGPGVVVQVDESCFRHKPKVYVIIIIKHKAILNVIEYANFGCTE